MVDVYKYANSTGEYMTDYYTNTTDYYPNTTAYDDYSVYYNEDCEVEHTWNSICVMKKDFAEEE